MPKLPNRWVCAKCGYDGLRTGELRATVDVSIAYGCPMTDCDGAMFRDDPLGEIERTHLPHEIAPTGFHSSTSIEREARAPNIHGE